MFLVAVAAVVGAIGTAFVILSYQEGIGEAHAFRIGGFVALGLCALFLVAAFVDEFVAPEARRQVYDRIQARTRRWGLPPVRVVRWREIRQARKYGRLVADEGGGKWLCPYCFTWNPDAREAVHPSPHRGEARAQCQSCRADKRGGRVFPAKDWKPSGLSVRSKRATGSR